MLHKHPRYLLCLCIHLHLPPVLFLSVLNGSFPLLAVKHVLYFNCRRKSLKPRCHMFSAIKRSLACVNLGVLDPMHLGGVCACAILRNHTLLISELEHREINSHMANKLHFLLLCFICLKIAQCHKSRILTMLHLESGRICCLAIPVF